MLAQTFKTAAELDIPEHESHALRTVLYMLEDGEIKKEQVYMARWHTELNCGTTHCLAGWANTVDKEAFPEIASLQAGGHASVTLTNRIPRELSKLFGTILHNGRSMADAKPEEATAALRHYLETGTCPARP